MSKLKFELIISKAEEQRSFELSEKPILIGNTTNCHIHENSDGPKIKAMMQLEDSTLVVKIYDTNYPIKLNGKKYKSAKLKKSSCFKIGEIDIVLDVSEVKDAELVTTEVTTEILSDYDDSVDSSQSSINLNNLNKSIPNLPTEMTSTNINLEVTKTQKINIDEEFDRDINRINKQVEESRRSINKVEVVPKLKEDGFTFNIQFEEIDFDIMDCLSYQDQKLDFSSYIELGDETIKKMPTREIHEENESLSIHIVQMNNGTALRDKYFPLNTRRIFLSNKYNSKNYFQVEDAASRKEEFLYSKDGKTYLIKNSDYELCKIENDHFEDVEHNVTEVLEGVKYILRKGTSQILIQITSTPKRIKTNRFFNIDESLLKSVATSWAFALLVLSVVVIFEAKKEEKKEKELVVIYKRQNIKKLEDKLTPPAKETAKTKLNTESPKKRVEEPTSKPQTSIVKKKPVQALRNKKAKKSFVSKNIKKKIRKTKRNLVKQKPKKVTKAKAPAPKKKFKFNFSNKMNSMMAKSSKTKLKQAKGSKNINAAASFNSSSSAVSEFNTANIGKSNNRIARFAAGNIAGSSKAIGTRGLSGKTRSTTAYIEANTKILGAMDPELIRKLMREFIPQFRHCYQRELLVNPSIAGVFDLDFQINANGVGVNVGVKSNGKGFSKKAVGCLKKVVKMIKFPKPKGGGFVDVKQPMNFYKQ